MSGKRIRHCMWKLSTNQCSRSQLQEESDTGIVLYAIDITKRDPFSELVVMCPDTDVVMCPDSSFYYTILK